jgi:outer membrane lipoprotein carrier protein
LGGTRVSQVRCLAAPSPSAQRGWLVVGVAAAFVWSAAVVGTAEQTAPELARAIQRRYDNVRDFSADFVHSYEGGVLRRQLVESGRLLVRKPGRMRWEYRAPNEKLFVSDGTKLYAYIPQDRQVTVSAVPSQDEATTSALFLAGKGDLIRDFTPSLVELPAGLPAGARALKLVPKGPQREYEWLVLAVDPTSLAIRGLVTVDAQGGTSTFSFTNLQENVGLTDKEFVFRIPRGVDVVTDSPRP